MNNEIFHSFLCFHHWQRCYIRFVIIHYAAQWMDDMKFNTTVLCSFSCFRITCRGTALFSCQKMALLLENNPPDRKNRAIFIRFYLERRLVGGWKNNFFAQELGVLSKGQPICKLYCQEKPLTPSTQKSLQYSFLVHLQAWVQSCIPPVKIES